MNIHDELISNQVGLHITCAGAGPELLQRLWSNTGVSAYFLGADFPYSVTETEALLGFTPEGSVVSEDIAYDFAMSSYLKACADDRTPIGLGVTAAVASDRMPKGNQRAHICVIYRDSVLYESVDLIKDTGKEARKNHDRIIASHCQYMLERVLRCETDPACEAKAFERFHAHPIWTAQGKRGGLAGRIFWGGLYMPATLNPLHNGHRVAWDAAESETGERVTYLVSSCSPHKGNRTVQELINVVAQVKADRKVNLCRDLEFTTDEPLFIDKAKRRPSSTFVIGADTMQRMLDPVWGPPIPAMLEELRKCGTKFLVAARTIDGVIMGCRDIPVPWPHQIMFQPLNNHIIDVSSTELREAANG